MIGITNNGEPTIDTSWVEKLKDESIEQFILTTKNPGGFSFSELGRIITEHKNKICIAGSISGFSKTRTEPETTTYISNLIALKGLYDMDINVELIISPIFSTISGLHKVKDVLNSAKQIFGIELQNLNISYNFAIKNQYTETRGMEYPESEDIKTEIVEYINDFNEMCNTKIHSTTILTNTIELLEVKPCPYNCTYCYNENHFKDDEVK